MNDEEKGVLHALPDRVAIYRGCGEDNCKGWCWTLSYEQAEWFAERFPGTPYAGFVLTGECSKSDIIAYLNGREEDEIIIAPHDVRVVSTEMMEKGDDDDQ